MYSVIDCTKLEGSALNIAIIEEAQDLGGMTTEGVDIFWEYLISVTDTLSL